VATVSQVGWPLPFWYVHRVALIRHAQSVWNADQRWQGWADPPLSEVGEMEALAVGRALATGTLGELITGAAVSSDLRRARQTAELLADQLGLPRPEVIDPELREIDVGNWSGLRREEIALRWPDELRAWDAGTATSAPGGEDRSEFASRVLAAVGRWLDSAEGVTRLVVTHGGVIRIVNRSAGAPGGPVPNLAGVLVESSGPGADPGRWVNTALAVAPTG